MRVRCHRCRSQYPLDMGSCPKCGVDFRQALASAVPPSARPGIKPDGRPPSSAGSRRRDHVDLKQKATRDRPVAESVAARRLYEGARRYDYDDWREGSGPRWC